MKIHCKMLAACMALSLGAFIGCGGEASGPTEMSSSPPELPGGHDHDGHDHPTEGPHHGSLIELGQESYHGELVHNEETGDVTIYVLDGAAKMAVPITEPEIAINVTHEGNGEQFKLTPMPMDTDPEGTSSRFVTSDAELGHHLHEAEAQARLVIKIDGKSYNGAIAAHDEHGHDHDHGHEH